MSSELPKLLNDWELWACALSFESRHGANVVAYIAERISELALAGDYDGVANFRIIAARIDRLQDAAWV
jgi:hypothetical protein